MAPNRPATSTKHKKINKWLNLRNGYWKRMIVTFLVNFALNIAYFSPIQIPIKWLPLLDLKLYFEGWIAQTQFKWNFRLSISFETHVWDLLDVLMALHSTLLRCTSLKLRSWGAQFSGIVACARKRPLSSLLSPSTPRSFSLLLQLSRRTRLQTLLCYAG